MNVKIYKPCKSSMQSGFAKYNGWVLECLANNDKEIDPLMGWVSSDDTIDKVKLHFDSCEDAVEFAKNKEWNYDIAPEKIRNIKPKSYLDNFK